MRKILTITVAAVTIAASAVSADPLLPAGKPAGVAKAQLAAGPELFVLGGIVAVVAGVAIATSGGRASAAGQGQPISVVTTTSP